MVEDDVLRLEAFRDELLDERGDEGRPQLVRRTDQWQRGAIHVRVPPPGGVRALARLLQRHTARRDALQLVLCERGAAWHFDDARCQVDNPRRRLVECAPLLAQIDRLETETAVLCELVGHQRHIGSALGGVEWCL